jgi:hypothetical protein
MSTPVTASTQYGDLVGTVEIDGHDTTPLSRLVSLTNMPPYFCPIGLEISLFDFFDDEVAFALLAYDSRTVGCGPEEMRAYIERHGELPVRRFLGTFRPTTAHRFFKRCSIVAVDSRTIEVSDKLSVLEEQQQQASPNEHIENLAKSKPR